MTTTPIEISDEPRAVSRRLRPSRGLVYFVLRRFAALVLLTLGITAVTFVLTQLVPTNAAATNLGEQAAGDPAAVAAFELAGLSADPDDYTPWLFGVTSRLIEHLTQTYLPQPDAARFDAPERSGGR